MFTARLLHCMAHSYFFVGAAMTVAWYYTVATNSTAADITRHWSTAYKYKYTRKAAKRLLSAWLERG
jgi:hypothetical protein